MTKPCRHCEIRAPRQDDIWCDHCIGILARSPLNEDKRRRKKPKPFPSPMEVRILRMLCDGLVQCQIAKRVGLSDSSINRLVRQMLDRSGCVTIASLTAWATLKGHWPIKSDARACAPVSNGFTRASAT